MSNRTSRRPLALLVTLAIVAGIIGLVPARAQIDPTTGPTFRFEGGGWGHGVGMSQHGAHGRAVAGHGYEDILGFYYPGSVLTEVDAPDDLRIHLHSARGTRINPTGEVEILNGRGRLLFRHTNGRRLTINKIPGGYEVLRPNGRNLCMDSGGTDRCRVNTLRVRFVQGEPVHVDAIGQVSIGTTDNSYQWGELVIRRRTFDKSGRTLWVILEKLSMDQYIYGLAEVPASWATETLKVQAVAGRTYAFDRAVSRRADADREEPWDLYSTVNDQVYYGYDKESSPFAEEWKAAVDATSDQVSLHDGRPITAFYSSSNGGWTEDSGYVFVTSLPYLPAQRDAHDGFQNPYGSWVRDYTGAEIGTWMAASSLGSVGVVREITVSGDIGRSGRVDRATVTVIGTRGSVTTSGNTFRNVLNAGIARAGGGLSRQILSTNFTVTALGGEDPVGAIDKVRKRGSSARVVGWVFDPDVRSSIDVDIVVDDRVVDSVTADGSRLDIDAVFGQGHSKGFDVVVPLDTRTKHQVCVYADNPGGERLLLGCRVV